MPRPQPFRELPGMPSAQEVRETQQKVGFLGRLFWPIYAAQQFGEVMYLSWFNTSRSSMYPPLYPVLAILCMVSGIAAIRYTQFFVIHLTAPNGALVTGFLVWVSTFGVLSMTGGRVSQPNSLSSRVVLWVTGGSLAVLAITVATTYVPWWFGALCYSWFFCFCMWGAIRPYRVGSRNK